MGRWSQFSEEQKDQLLDSLESGLYNNPEVGMQVKEAVEKAFGFTDPELALTRRHSKQVEDLQTKIDNLENSTREDKIRNRIQKDKDDAAKKFRLNDDEMAEVSKMMVEQGIGNYNTAAEYYHLTKAAAKPTSDKVMEHTALTLPNDLELFKDRSGWARKEAYKAIAEIERNRAA